MNLLKKYQRSTESAIGSLAQYANPSLWEKEEKAWEKDVLKLGLETYAEYNLDFVDCILYAYKSLKNYDVLTFDKKLKRLLDNV